MIPPNQWVARGVYCAPCLSDKGEIILYAVDHNHRHLPEELGGIRRVPVHENPEPINEQLWTLLEILDPVVRIWDVA
jgi:hypothetical protein